MRIARVQVEGNIYTARVDGETVHLLEGDTFDRPVEMGRAVPLSQVRLLVPCVPTKVVAIGINYKSHAGERPAPGEPQGFLKAPSSLIAQGESIVLPPDSTNVHMEAEVVAVIGRRTRNVSESDVDAYVFGYTAGNDVSERAWQQSDLQWLRAKSSDTFTAVGPWIETDLKPEAIHVAGRISGRLQQESDTSLLIHPIRKCIAHISRYLTLEPGDLVFTGTPGQTAPIVDGDLCEVEVGGVGVLHNPVRRG
ncbi:MAG: FAA hydrolase family protein [Dehalococcoidia bacterium]|nr:MAG: FAA hydrolase family protein [Dehalococcoidia bacterium]